MARHVSSSASYRAARRARLGVAGLPLVVALAACLVALQPRGDALAASAGAREQALVAYETRMLGAAHAAEHAQQRAATQAQPATGESSGGTANVQAAEVAAAPAPADGGAWDPAKIDLPVFAIHSALLPTGKVLMFAFALGERNYENATLTTAEAWLWDPAKGTGAGAFRQVDAPVDPATGQPVDIWCGGNSFTADGQLLVAGGNRGSTNGGLTWKGLNHVYTFDPFTETWTRQPDLRGGRWYPTQLRMPDGRTVILGGEDETGSGAANKDVEVFTPAAARGGQGTITRLNQQLDTWFWFWPVTPASTPIYPRMHWMRSGRGLVSGPAQGDSWYFRAPGADNNLVWEDAPNPAGWHFYGTSVALPGGWQGPTRVMAVGGGTSSKLSEVLDESAPGTGWKTVDELNVARGHHNDVLLPDGTHVVIGGGTGGLAGDSLYDVTEAHKQVELWDPATETWRLGAAQSEGRAYHSTALLLPDGRVWSAGDNLNGGFTTDTAELYSPPYLFKGPRPTITSAPDSVALDATFQVGTPDTDIARAVLVAPGATTHGVDMNQRHVELRLVSSAPGTVTVQAPPDGNAAPAGYYMLFLLDDQGVPSVARFLRLT